MCILAIAWQAHPRWHLVAAANRDERHDRPAAALIRWTQPNHIIAGKDLQSGGTWLGVSERGRFAAVTNVRNPDGPKAGLSSRGALVTDFLAGEGQYADPARAEPADFNPYNLITARGDQAWFQSNRPEPMRRLLAPGVYGLANGGLDEPWRKTLEIKAAMREWIDADRQPEALFDVLLREIAGGSFRAFTAFLRGPAGAIADADIHSQPGLRHTVQHCGGHRYPGRRHGDRTTIHP